MFLEVDDGTLLHYETDGDPGRPALLLWHGARCTLRQWDYVTPRLTDRFFLVKFDIRGAGYSRASSSTDYNFTTYATDACRLLESLGIAKCHIWSMAWGSRAALAFCAFEQERVISAALFDLNIGEADIKAQQAGYREAMRRLSEEGFTPPTLPNGWNHHIEKASMDLSLTAATKSDLSSLAPLITRPVLIATGDHDPNLRSSREAAKLIRGAKMVELRNIGHGSVLMHPDLCIQVFKEFAKQHI